MTETAIVIVKLHDRNQELDIEVPLDITPYELTVGLNTAYQLGIDVSNLQNCYLKAENPIALLRGSKTLQEFGVRNGTVIHFTG